jgi:alkylation response protein AidB-like acyl-CoA dehydrogenase
MFQSYKEQATNLAGQIAFLKMYSTRCAQDTARDAVQIFGGRGITQTGMGRFIEHASGLLAWHAASWLTVSDVLSIIERSLSIRF